MEFLEASIFQKGYIDGITILNLDGEILFSAKFNKKLSNLDEAQQLIGQNFLDVYPNLTPQSSTLYRAMQFGRPVYEEKQYLKKRGKDGILITSISFPIKNGDRIVGAIDLSMQESEEEEDGLPNSRIELSRDSFQRDRTQKLSTSASAAFRTEDIIAVNQKMCQAKDYISVVASCDLPVMLCGETGTGKDVFAQAIHNASARRDGPFIAQNCAAIPDTLLESILFGTAKGAFTGAVESKGLLELADHGTLFLDELAEFPRGVLEVLRQPLEEKCIHLARQQGAYIFPADFMLVAATNPCPCGMAPGPQCTCTPGQIRNYQGKLSQPFLDRIDICMEAPKVEYEELTGKGTGMDSRGMREKVMLARMRQMERFQEEKLTKNAQMGQNEIEKYCRLGKEEERMMRQAYEVMNLTVRSYHKVLKVARTIADLEEKEEIDLAALREALGYRVMDKEYWG